MNTLMKWLDSHSELPLLAQRCGFLGVKKEDPHEGQPQEGEQLEVFITGVACFLARARHIVNKHVSHRVNAQLAQLRKPFKLVVPCLCQVFDPFAFG